MFIIIFATLFVAYLILMGYAEYKCGSFDKKN